MVAYALLGVLLGAGSCVVPGPCSLAVMAAARRHGLRRAVATGAGSALGDLSYAALGVVGVGGVLARHPAAVSVMLAVSGVMLVGYGLSAPRAGPTSTAPSATLGGVPVGLATVLSNPGALVTWVVIVGAQLGDATAVERWSAVLGIGAGSWAWYAGLACASVRVRRARAMQRVTRVVSGALVCFGVVCLARAVHHLG